MISQWHLKLSYAYILCPIWASRQLHWGGFKMHDMSTSINEKFIRLVLLTLLHDYRPITICYRFVRIWFYDRFQILLSLEIRNNPIWLNIYRNFTALHERCVIEDWMPSNWIMKSISQSSHFKCVFSKFHFLWAYWLKHFKNIMVIVLIK